MQTLIAEDRTSVDEQAVTRVCDTLIEQGALTEARQLADSTAFVEDLDTFRNDVLNSARQARVQYVLQSLRASATVEDLRKELALAQREQQDQIPQTPFGF